MYGALVLFTVAMNRWEQEKEQCQYIIYIEFKNMGCKHGCYSMYPKTQEKCAPDD